MLKNTNVYLIGMMGAGKSTCGQLLAQRLNYKFFDTDQILTQATGLTIRELFEQGEDAFRSLETQVLRELAPCTRVVVATGGGAVLRRENWSYLHAGVVVWLDVPLPTLLERTARDPQERPLQSRLAELLEQRLPLYQQADVVITALGPPEAVCQSILLGLQQRIDQDRDYVDRFIGR